MNHTDAENLGRAYRELSQLVNVQIAAVVANILGDVAPVGRGMDKLRADVAAEEFDGVFVESGTREWAMVMAMRGRRALVGDPSGTWSISSIPYGPRTGWRLAST